MKFTPYSVSKIECYIDCPKKFEWRYILKPEVNSSYIHLEKGKLWHTIIEHAIKRTTKNFVKPRLTEMTQEMYLVELKKSLQFIKSNFFLPYLQDIMIYKQLTEQRFSINEKGEAALDKGNNPLMKGFIDLYQFNDTDAVIVDWKTGGKSIESLKKFQKSSFQLEVYAYVIWKLFSPKNICARYVYVEHEYQYVMNNFNHLDTWREITYWIDQIEKTTSFERKETALCDYCEFRGLCLI